MVFEDTGNKEHDKRGLLFFIYGGIGNMVMALPAINAAQKALPPGSVSLAVQKGQMLELIRPESFGATLSLDWPEYQGPRGLPQAVSRLRAVGPDTTVASVPFPRRKYGLLALLAGAETRICEQTPFTLGCNAAIKTSAKHYLERNLEMLRGIGLEQRFAGFDISLKSKYEQEAGDFLMHKGFDGRNVAGVHPGAGNPHKRWPEDSFIELGRQLAGRGWELVIFGGPDETELADRVAGGIGKQATAYYGTGPLERTLALIKQCRVFISNDSGPAHCAAALGVFTYAIFGPTDPEVCRPYGDNVRVIRSAVPCSPCYHPGKSFKCSKMGMNCLKGISVKTVLEAIEKPEK